MSPASKSHPTSIIHAVGFAAAILFSLVLLFYNLFHTSANHRFPPAQILSPRLWASLLTYRFDPQISCQTPVLPQLPAWLDSARFQLIAPIAGSPDFIAAEKLASGWTIYRADSATQALTPMVENIFFDSSNLVHSYQPVARTLMYPECPNNHCRIVEHDLASGQISSFPAFGTTDKQALTQIRDVFFDEAKKLVSYGTSADPKSERVVINPHLELIQTINENPSENHRLSFTGYQPEPGYLVYADSGSPFSYFYLIDSIGLYRTRCPG